MWLLRTQNLNVMQISFEIFLKWMVFIKTQKLQVPLRGKKKKNQKQRTTVLCSI